MFVLKNKKEGTYFGKTEYSYEWVKDLNDDTIKTFETKKDAEDYIHNTLIAPFYTEDEPIIIVEIDDLKHKYGPGYMQDEIEFSDKTTYLEEQLARAYELIKRGTKQSTEGLLEGIKYDNDVRSFLKDYELREDIKNNKEII